MTETEINSLKKLLECADGVNFIGHARSRLVKSLCGFIDGLMTSTPQSPQPPQPKRGIAVAQPHTGKAPIYRVMTEGMSERGDDIRNSLSSNPDKRFVQAQESTTAPVQVERPGE